MRKANLFVFVFIFSFFLSNFAYATQVQYDVNNIGSNRWEYTYTITNDTLTQDIQELAIYFDYGLYGNIAISASPVDWDTIAIEPDFIFGIPEDGFIDTLALTAGLPQGASLSGLIVSFDWYGTNNPNSQRFAVLDSTTYETLYTGSTTPAQSSSVPESSTIVLISFSLVGLLGLHRKMWIGTWR